VIQRQGNVRGIMMKSSEETRAAAAEFGVRKHFFKRAEVSAANYM